MGRYAEGTTVPVERSRMEIERLLTRYKATKFGVWSEPSRALVQFEAQGRTIQIPVTLPKPDDPKRPRDRYGSKTFGAAAERWVEQETRRRWRVLMLTLKAMLESIETGLVTFDQAFLAHMVLPGTARTLGDALIPKLDALYSGTTLPALLAENL